MNCVQSLDICLPTQTISESTRFRGGKGNKNKVLLYLDMERAFDRDRDRDTDLERDLERRDDFPLGDLLQVDS